MEFNIQRFGDTEYLKDNLNGFVPQVVSDEIIGEVVRGSSVLRLSQIEYLESDNKKFSVIKSGLGAFWTDEAARIKTQVAEWDFPEIKVKKIAVIVPLTKEKLNDATIDIFGTLQGYIAEAFYKAIDSACLFGINSPFDDSIVSAAIASGNVVGDNQNNSLDLNISDVMAKVEAAGYDVNGFAAGLDLKNSLRKLRDLNGNQLYVEGVDRQTLYNQPIEFNRNDAWDSTKALAIAGEWKYSIVGIRSEIEYTINDTATLQTVTMADGKPLSLFENDMAALKATMRIGFLPVQPKAFAILQPSGGQTYTTGRSKS